MKGAATINLFVLIFVSDLPGSRLSGCPFLSPCLHVRISAQCSRVILNSGHFNPSLYLSLSILASLSLDFLFFVFVFVSSHVMELR
jgi:hypothetical protein